MDNSSNFKYSLKEKKFFEDFPNGKKTNNGNYICLR